MSLSPEQIPSPAVLGERLRARQAQSEEMGELLPFPDTDGQNTGENGVESPAVGHEVTTTSLPGASREQGPPDSQSVDPTMSAPEEQPIDLPEAASPVLSTRERGGASRPQGPAASESQPSTSTARSSGKLELADLVTVGKSGRAHVSGSQNTEGHSRNGQFLSQYETEQIEAHEEQIRKGLSQLAAERGLGQVDENGRAHRENGQIMSNKELAALLGNNKYVHPETSAADEASDDAELDNIVAALDGEEPVVVEQSANQPEPAGGDPDAAPAENAPVAEAEEPVRLTLKQRIVRRLKLAGTQLYLLPLSPRNALQKAGNYLNDEEKGRRRGIVAGVVGVAAVGGAVMAYKYGGDLFHHSADVQPKGAGAPNKDLADLLTGRGGGAGKHDQSVVDALQGGHPGGHEAIESQLTLERGGTIWDSLSQQGAEHGHHLSEVQLHDLTSQTLKANGLTWEEARQLPVGYHFNIPPEVTAALEKS
ncbi:hypothetical protein BH09PAT4_BH09PAT4_08770 [soil metagenome]